MAAKKQGQKRKHPAAQKNSQRKKVIDFPVENRPLLSIGMIFRDDIRCIERCLRALQPLRDAVPCQLVMADTGSVDGSRTVAERYADLVFDFPWIGDFSAARNAVMDRCTGVWYLTVDTDEYLDEDFAQLTDFLRDKSSLWYDYGFVTVRNYRSEDMLAGDCYDFSAVRIQRSDVGKRYHGAIHESWYIDLEKEPACDLLRTVFHHDGYTAEVFAKKQKRNMPLLKRELEQNPGDMNRILQCLESCYTREDGRKYSEIAVECAPEFQRTYPAASRDSILGAAMRGAVQCATKYGFRELEDWVILARKLVPDSIYVGVDIAYLYAVYNSNAGKMEQCLEELSRYWEEVERFDRGDFDPMEFRVSVLHCAYTAVRQQARLLQVGALVELGRWTEALETLTALPAETLANGDITSVFLRSLLRIWRESEEDCAPLLLQSLEGIEQDDSKEAYQRRKTFLALCRDAFRDTETDDPAEQRKVHELFLQLDESCDLGRAARIMEAQDPETVRALLGGVEEWEFFPTEAIDRALKLNILPPEEFYRQKSEVLNFHAARLISLRKEDIISLLVFWDDRMPDAPTVQQIMWLYYLTASAVQKEKWKKNGSDTLFDLFRDKVALYLDTFFRPELCTEEFIQLQPALVRFGWYCVQAGNAWDSNDPLDYTRWLKKALKTDPDMRDMVQFLSKRVKDLAEQPKPVSPELLALANQVRMILAAYPADHPAVLAIKQSEAYQQVAYLLT